MKALLLISGALLAAAACGLLVMAGQMLQQGPPHGVTGMFGACGLAAFCGTGAFFCGYRYRNGDWP